MDNLASYKYELEATVGTVTDLSARMSYETVIQLVVDIVMVFALASGFIYLIIENINLKEKVESLTSQANSSQISKNFYPYNSIMTCPLQSNVLINYYTNDYEIDLMKTGVG